MTSRILTFCLMLFFSFTTLQLNAQLRTTKKEKKYLKHIEKDMYNWNYHSALDRCNKYLKKQPSAQIYYQRGLNHYYLNDPFSSAQDFKKSIDLGIEKQIDSNEVEFLKWMYDTTFIVESAVDSVHQLELDKENHYAKKYSYSDTLRGDLRPERSCFDVFYQNLSVKINPEKRTISGSNEISFIAKEKSKKIQIDLFEQYNITEISIAGEHLNYIRSYNAIFIDLKEELVPDKKYTIKITYHGTPQEAIEPPWAGGFVWKENNGRYYSGVACERLGASSWWPNKDHLSDKPDSMDINIAGPTGYQIISNGDLIDTTQLDDSYTNFHWHVSFPINNYNVTFYLGDFVHFAESYKNIEGEMVDIDYHVLEQNLDTAKEYYAKTIDIIQCFENKFGVYPFSLDGLAYVESPFCGMEHQSAIAIGGEYFNDYYPNRGGYSYLVVHETAHEWWGNSVAVGDMADVWINEGFATYAEALFSEEQFGKERYLEDITDNMSNILNLWPVVGNEKVNDNAFIGQDIYSKGAVTLHNLRCIYNNDSEFFRMLKDFYQDAKLKISTTEDFTYHAQQYTDVDLKDFFQAFLYQKTPPILEYYFKPGPFKRLQFTYRWTNVGKDFTMPVLLTLNNSNSFRIEASTEWNTEYFVGAHWYFLENHTTIDYKQETYNAFTYYFSKLVK